MVGSPLSRRPQPQATPACACCSDPRGCVDALSGPPVARAPVLRPSNLTAGEALPLLLFVLFLAYAFLRAARQEGPPVAGLPLSRRPQPPATPASSYRSDPRGCIDELPDPPVARAPVLRPSNLTAGKALPLLLFVLASSRRLPCGWLIAVSASPAPNNTGIFLPLRLSRLRRCTSWPSCCSRSRPSPEQPCGWQATLRLARRRCRFFSSFLRPLGVFPAVADSPLSRRPQPPTTPASSCRSDPRGYVDALPGPPVARAPVLRPSNLTLARRCRSFSSFSSSRTRSCVKHGRKGLWFHRRCRGKWSCQKGLLRRHLY